MKALTPRKTLQKKTLRDLNGDEFSISAGDPAFGGLVQGEPVVFESNFPQPRQHLAFKSREFLAIDILGEQKSIAPLPWGLDVELSGTRDSRDHKYFEARFALNLSSSLESMTVGESPVRIQIAVRKGASPGSDNKSILRLSFAEFERVLNAGRDFINYLRTLEKKEFNSYDEIQLPNEVVIRKRAPEMNQNHSTYVLMSVSILKHNRDSNIVRPMISIREYIEDKKNDVHIATAKGIGVGLKAFHHLVFPCAFATRKMHDAFLQVNDELKQ
jgi:hypothetical protein